MPQAAGLTASLFAGALLGTLVLGPLADRRGRRPVCLLAAALISTAGLLAAAAPHYLWLLLALALVGVGVGGLTVPFDVLAEFLPNDHRRGTHLLCIEYFWTAGCLYVVLLAYLLLESFQQQHWRLLTALCALPCLLSLDFGLLLPPRVAPVARLPGTPGGSAGNSPPRGRRQPPARPQQSPSRKNSSDRRC